MKKPQLNSVVSEKHPAIPNLNQDNGVSTIMNKKDFFTISPFLTTTRQFPPAIKQWVNSIYSFNQNYTKNLPAADNIVNKIIRSFFSISPLANNPDGKKSKLLQRRYKRLSLNKILVSKSEIKHSNDKVFITVHLFNKKKISLLHKLENLYQTISYKKFTSKDLNHKLSKRINYKKAIKSKTRKIRKYNALLGSSNILFHRNYNVLRKNKISKRLFNKNKFANLDLRNKSYEKKILYYKTLNNLTRNSIYKFFALLDKNTKQSTNKNTVQFTNLQLAQILENLTTSLFNSTNNSKGNSALKTEGDTLFLNSNLKNLNLNSLFSLMRNYYSALNKYKLYSNNTDYLEGLFLQEKTSAQQGETKSLSLSVKNPKAWPKVNKAVSSVPMYKLNVLYKSFAIYNNINSIPQNSSLASNEQSAYNTIGFKNTTLYSSKILLNTYKLLNKSYLNINNVKTTPLKNKSTLKTDKAGLKPLKLRSTLGKNKASVKTTLLNTKLKNKRIPLLKVNKSNHELDQMKNQNNLKASLLLKKIHKIDRFFKKYQDSISNTALALPLLPLHVNNVSSAYKLNFIREFLHQELLYVYYIKLLSFNNAVFKNWFLLGLKNVISKIYNKKVVFNLISLKYIHLNSDILSQAIAIKLRNFKKNRVTKVLRKVLKLVTISKMNVYTFDIHSPAYKYMTQHYNKFKTLNLDIFNDLSNQDFRNKVSAGKNSESLTSNYTPTTIRKLNHTQASTINFIKYKSVFGVRLEASGRLTKRSTASRSIFKLRYKGSLKNNPVLSRSLSSVILKNNRISNLQYTKISSKTRNGSFGLKGWINSN